MAHSVRWLTYYIVLTDPDLVKQYQTQFPNGYQFAPYNPGPPAGGAAVAFNAPWAGSEPGTAVGNYVGPAPYTWSPVWTALNNYDQSVATFERKTGGVWGIGGDTVRYYWIGIFVLAASETPTVSGVEPVVVATIPRRRWSEGFELGEIGPVGIAPNTGISVSRDAARHVGGMGLALRGAIAATTEATLETFDTGYTAQESWERLYLRVREIDPTAAVTFWECFGVESSNVGAALAIQAAGVGGATLVVLKKAAGVYTTVASGGVLVPWTGLGPASGFYKIDIILRYADAAALTAYSGVTLYHLGDLVSYLGVNYKCKAYVGPSDTGLTGHAPTETDYWEVYGEVNAGRLRVYLNGVLTIDASFPAGAGGLGNQGYHHRGSTLGQFNGSPPSSTYLDIDDWFNADIPRDPATGDELLTSLDWLNGTKIVNVMPKAYSVNHSANWLGDVRMLIANLLGLSQMGIAPGVTVTSSTSGAILEVETDSDLTVDGDYENAPLGVASLSVSLASTSVGSTDGQLGYGLAGAAPVMTTINQVVSPGNAKSVFYSVNGFTTTLPDITPIRFRFTKAADANAVVLHELRGQAELVGAWGVEDYRQTENPAAGAPTFPQWIGQHNAPYPSSSWGRAPIYAPNGPYIVYSGTYVGNNTAQDLTFKSPIHFLYIRPVTGDAGGAKWWSSMLGVHRAVNRNVFPAIVAIDRDPTFVPGAGDDTQQERYRVRIAGTDSQFNATGVSYQYLAISDPSARFLLNLAIAAKTTTASLLDYLVNSGFTPELAFIFPEAVSGATTGQPLMKGPGNTAAGVSSFSVNAALASAMTFAAGLLTTQANLHALNALGGSLPIMLLRRADGNNDPGQNAVMAIVSWVGDGTASRTLSLPVTGKRPIFAIATGDGAAGGYQRDVSHLTNTSSSPTGASVTTGITAGGIDSISVGALLNVNLVAYNMLVLVGDATAGNGGFGVDGTYVPVQADYPTDGPAPQPPDPSAFNPVVPPVPLSADPDLDVNTPILTTASNIGGMTGGSACEIYTRMAVNIALSRLGISKVVGNLATEQSEAAALARRSVLEDVNRTLRDFPWPFATAYANLVLVTGTPAVPANTDWIYAYRAPNAMMFARRIATAGAGRAFDPTPIPFRHGIDAGGALIYCNTEATTTVPLVLEYTTRVACPAFFGDALFRDALAWRFAASLSPLSRDAKKAEVCEQMYRDVLERARTVDAKEQQQDPDGDAEWILGRG